MLNSLQSAFSQTLLCHYPVNKHFSLLTCGVHQKSLGDAAPYKLHDFTYLFDSAWPQNWSNSCMSAGCTCIQRWCKIWLISIMSSHTL